MRKFIIRTILRLTGWRPEGQPPKDIPRYVLIAYPHTATRDFFLLLSYAFLHDIPLRFMIKDSMFWFPLGVIIRALGGIPIDRSTRSNTVERMAATLQREERIVLSVPPEGTRKWVPHWKSGFYHVARLAGVPLVLSYIDGPNKRFGVGPVIELSGDVEADLDKLREFYAPIRGIYPERTGPVRFKESPETTSCKDDKNIS